MILCKKSQTSGVKSVLEWIYDSSGSCSGECLASYKVEPGVILQQLYRIQPLRSFIFPWLQKKYIKEAVCEILLQ